MDHHLGREDQAGNNRNGYGRKTVVTDTGKIEIEVPRDRAGSFDPQLIAKYQRRFPGFDDKIVSKSRRRVGSPPVGLTFQRPSLAKPLTARRISSTDRSAGLLHDFL
jgi:transposase-like protein